MAWNLTLAVLPFVLVSGDIRGSDNPDYYYRSKLVDVTSPVSSITYQTVASDSITVQTLFTFENCSLYMSQDATEGLYHLGDVYITCTAITKGNSIEWSSSYTLPLNLDILWDESIDKVADFSLYKIRSEVVRDIDTEFYFTLIEGSSVVSTSDKVKLNTNAVIDSYEGIEVTLDSTAFNAMAMANAYNVRGGWSDGYRDGRASGYAHGFQDGQDSDSVAFTIFNGILAIGMLPVNFFIAIFNFDILGINVSAFMLSLLTVCLAIVVIRMMKGS